MSCTTSSMLFLNIQTSTLYYMCIVNTHCKKNVSESVDFRSGQRWRRNEPRRSWNYLTSATFGSPPPLSTSESDWLFYSVDVSSSYKLHSVAMVKDHCHKRMHFENMYKGRSWCLLSYLEIFPNMSGGCTVVEKFKIYQVAAAPSFLYLEFRAIFWESVQMWCTYSTKCTSK